MERFDGNLTQSRMPKMERKAYRLYSKLKERHKVEFDVRDFIGWYLENRGHSEKCILRKIDDRKKWVISNIIFTPGRLNPRSIGLCSQHADQVTKKADSIFKNQKERCENERAPSFKNYGGRGIRVEYSRSDFHKWFSKEVKKRKNKTALCVGRVDHSKNYCFGNIEVTTRSENSEEVVSRLGLRKKVSMFESKSLKLISTFNSSIEASHAVGVHRTQISRDCRKLTVPRTRGFFFRYA